MSTKDHQSDPRTQRRIARLAGSDGPPATSVCDWARLDLCKLKDAEGPASLIPCAVKGCDRFLHHMCQTEWECLDDCREAHGTRKLCAHHHPALADTHSRADKSPLAACPGSSQSTMSTLTNTTYFPLITHIDLSAKFLHEDANETDEQEPPEPPLVTLPEDDESAEELPFLKHIWDCAYIEKHPTGWKCLWCGNLFVPVHATRALSHVLRLKKAGIKACSVSIPANYLSRYEGMRYNAASLADSKKRGADFVDDIVQAQQTASVVALLAKRRVGAASWPADCKGGFGSVASFPPSSHKVSSSASLIQPSISAGLQHQTDIRKVNNALAQMAIADFFHCENIPDGVVESPRFKRMVYVLGKVGSDFEIPKHRQIGGPLLELNYQTKYSDNKTNLLKSAQVFGLGFLGDGATVKRMPLMNILASCADTPPITISIHDCTKHMQVGGKKDASYVAGIFEDKVREYDPNNTLTDLFFFDGASNVQKAGEILVAKFPHSFCFHGGEHVVSLFFSSISKIKPIKVSLLGKLLDSVNDALLLFPCCFARC